MALGQGAVKLRLEACLAETAAEVMVELKPPQRLFADSLPAIEPGNHLRFRFSPSAAAALAAGVKRTGKAFVGEQREFYLHDEQPGEEAPYARLLRHAMAGDGALFARKDAIEAIWAAVDPLLIEHHRTLPDKRGSWGFKEAHALIAADGCWYNPRFADVSSN